MKTINLNLLQYNWTADVILNNGKQITIWHTAWPMIKRTVKDILSVSSDYPKHSNQLTTH
jgi:hypothetical protein